VTSRNDDVTTQARLVAQSRRWRVRVVRDGPEGPWGVVNPPWSHGRGRTSGPSP